MGPRSTLKHTHREGVYNISPERLTSFLDSSLMHRIVSSMPLFKTSSADTAGTRQTRITSRQVTSRQVRSHHPQVCLSYSIMALSQYKRSHITNNEYDLLFGGNQLQIRSEQQSKNHSFFRSFVNLAFMFTSWRNEQKPSQQTYSNTMDPFQSSLRRGSCWNRPLSVLTSFTSQQSNSIHVSFLF